LVCLLVGLNVECDSLLLGATVFVSLFCCMFVCLDGGLND
jgi:hypothetical protein